MRKTIIKKAEFDINKLDVISHVKKWFSPWKFFYADYDDFVEPKHWKRLYEAYAGEKSIANFEGDHNSERPDFYYDSASIFFYNVLGWEEIPPLTKVDEDFHLRLPELDSTSFRKLGQELRNGENDELVKFDDRINFVKNCNRKEDIKSKLKDEDEETKKVILRSMATYTEEREKDEEVITILDKFGLFRQFSNISLGDKENKNLLEGWEDKLLQNRVITEVDSSRSATEESSHLKTFSVNL